MENKHMLMGLAGGVVVAAGIITWLLSGSSQPISIDLGNGVVVQPKISMKDTAVTRDKDGVKLWEFKVDVVEQDKKNNKAVLRGIKGKIYRSDGSYIDITADKGEATLNKANNDFSVEGNVKAILNTGGKIYGDKFIYIEKTKVLQAHGNVKLQKDEYTACADYAETTAAMEKFKLKGNAKVEKGGIWDDK